MNSTCLCIKCSRFKSFKNIGTCPSSAHPCFRENLWKTEIFHSFGDKATSPVSLIRPERLVLVEACGTKRACKWTICQIFHELTSTNTAVMLGLRYTHEHSLPPETRVDASQIIAKFSKLWQTDDVVIFSRNIGQLVDM